MSQEETSYRRGMVVVAHADDAEWGCAGTVAKWCAEGWEVVYVLCTDGGKGSNDPQVTSEELTKIRRQEQLNAGKVLGLREVVFLEYPDSMLQPTLELRRDIAREIRRYRPRCADLHEPGAAAIRKRLLGPSGPLCRRGGGFVRRFPHGPGPAYLSRAAPGGPGTP